jgi:hypothetical protein
MLPFRQACFRSAIESILKRECPQKARPAKETEAYVQGANFTAESSKSRRWVVMAFALLFALALIVIGTSVWMLHLI